MSENRVFNIETADLSSDMVLEASAGTGKTYSLEHLVVRYILEKGLSIKEILVVTFTEKAASELKKRIKALIRKKLAEAENQLFEPEGSRPDGMPDLSPESGRDNSSLENLREKYSILKNALFEFPEAPVFTIHGFCQSSLSGFPVESGLPFDYSISTSNDIYSETVLDYFRMIDVETEDEYIPFRTCRKSFNDCCEFLTSLLKKEITADNVVIYPDDEVVSAYTEIKSDFKAEKGDIYKSLRQIRDVETDTDLIASICNKMKPGIRAVSYQVLSESINEISRSAGLFDLFTGPLTLNYKNIKKLSISSFQEKERDRSVLDEREYQLSSSIDSLLSLPEGFCFDEGRGCFPYKDIAGSVFVLKALPFLEQDLYIRKMKNSELYFSDLIRLMHKALTDSSRREEFIKELGRKYRLVLIDEFQDTDNLQWEIFSSLFSSDNRKTVLIGDPKQSIYRFRGADIEVYFKAVEEIRKTGNSYMLETNYRSEKRLVKALNRMFENVFSLNSGGGHRIDFKPVNYKEDKEKLLERGGVEFLAVDNETAISAENVKVLLEQLFAVEIKKLIETGQVNASDICILLESNDDCRNMYNTLISLNIPAVYDGETDLFESDEIYSMLDFLSAVSSPYDRGKIIKTLLSPLFDYQLSELPAPDDDSEFEKISAVFLEWKELTDRGRFSSVINQLTGGKDIFPVKGGNSSASYLIRRITEVGGERKLTNIEHIGELLVSRNRSGRENASELTSWLVSVMEGAENEEEKVTRLERDDRSVRIMTMHKSKGLEFPVVFFGGGMKGGRLPGSDLDFFEYTDGGNRNIDLVKQSRNRLKHYCEQWEERKRLYYVAFTRAEQKLYLPLFKSCGLNYLSSLYGAMVFEELCRDLEEEGITPQIPLVAVKPPEKMKVNVMVSAITEKIFNLVTEKYNDGVSFNVNTETYEAVQYNSIEPLFSGSSSTGSKEKNEDKEPLVFIEAEPGQKSKKISVVSYSSIVKGESPHAEEAGRGQTILLGDNSPGDEEAVLKSDPEPGSPEDADTENYGELQDGSADEPSEEKEILKGPQFGNLMHTLLERADYNRVLSFKSPDEMFSDEVLLDMAENVSRQFLPHDRIKQSLSPVMALLHGTLHGKFTLPGEDDAVKIGMLQDENRRHELEFLLKVKKGRGSRLLNLPSLILEEGYIKGFIDLLFQHKNFYYIADWKTNYLGKGKEDYRGKKLEEAMAEHNYYLQMKLYMTALARIISVRENITLEKAADRIGGCFYFFLRGLDCDEPDSGVYFSRPDKEEILRFSDTFFEGAE